MPTIALVDDDHNILTSVSIALEAEGCRVMTYSDGFSALQGFKTSPPDLAILDIKMPRMDGMELLRRLREKSDKPVIFLTSKEREMDELCGLRIGADDFIRKPFSQRVLIERVKVLLRQPASRAGARSGEAKSNTVECGQLHMDPSCWYLEGQSGRAHRHGVLDPTGPREPPRRGQEPRALMDAAYDDQVYVDDRTIDSHMKRLRRKLKAVDDGFEMIDALYGVGYRFKETGSRARQ